MESCGMSVIKYALFIFNLIFAISGIGIIIAGAVVLASIGNYNHFLDHRLLAPPIVLIVAGAIVFLIAFLGCFGAIRESYGMLIAFSVLLLIIFIVELAVGIGAAVFKSDFQMAMKTTLKSSMANYSVVEAEKVAWDNFQTKLQCCGVDGADDWNSITGKIPMSCCQELPESNEAPDADCASANKKMNYLRKTGCFMKLAEEAHYGAKILIGVGISIAFIEILGIVLACILAQKIKQDNDVKS